MGADSTYSVDISEDFDGGEPVALAHGSLKLAELTIKEGIGRMREGVEYAAIFCETENVGGETKRTITRITADPSTVALVLKDKIKREKAENAAGTTTANANADGDKQDGGDMAVDRADGIA